MKFKICCQSKEMGRNVEVRARSRKRAILKIVKKYPEMEKGFEFFLKYPATK